jgi:hypothetical protein
MQIKMWKHEILSTIKSSTPLIKHHPEFVEHVYRSVLQSQQFFINDMVSTRESLKTVIITGSALNFKIYPMPYPNTLLCYHVYGLKGASLYCEYPDKKSNVAMIVDLMCDPDIKGRWIVLPACIAVKEDGSCLNYCFSFREDEHDLSHCGSRLVALSLLLSCKNISQTVIDPSPKINKKKEKNGKIPLYSYRVLMVGMEGQSATTPDSPTGGTAESHNRLHFQRGHFKQYSETRPLFGKLSGLYWWQPHIRGQNKNGFVDKEYRIKDDPR